MGVLILKIKEVTPEKIPQRFSTFWQEHVKRHRDYLRSQRGSVKTRSSQEKDNTMTLLEEVRNVLNVASSDEDGLEDTFLQTLFEKARHDSDYADILRWTGKPALSQSSATLHRMLSRTTTNNNHEKSVTILDAIRNSTQFPITEEVATSPSKNYTRTISEEDKVMNNDNLYKQAKMIQRSRSIGTGLSRRRRQILSKRLKRVQIEVPKTNNQVEQTCVTTEPLEETSMAEKCESVSTENHPKNNSEGGLENLSSEN